MNTVLINPPFKEKHSVGSYRSMRYVLNIVPPLGLAYLASVLERNKLPVRIFDFTVENFDYAFRNLVSQSPQLIGINASLANFGSAKALASKIRERLPGSILVIGGAYITAMPYEVMQEGVFDIGVIGEGEETFLELVKHIMQKGMSDLSLVKGIIFKEGGKWVINQRRGYLDDLDMIPYPARNLLPPLSRYSPTPASYKKLPLAVVITSRGCPHGCTFCDRSVFGNIYRKRSPENVLGEIEEVVNKYGAKEIRFFDDCFTMDKDRVYRICSGIRQKKIKVSWTCLTTVGSIDKDLLKEMKSSGCWQVLYGLESADEAMLKSLNKSATVEQNANAVRWAKEAGLSVRADFIIGTPGETEESLQKTLDFAIKMKIDYAHFNKFVPYPGTELYKMLKAKNYDFDFSKGASITDSHFLYIPETLSKEKYTAFINYAHKKFYLRIGYILKRLFSIRNWGEFKGQAMGFLAVFLLYKRKSDA